MNGIRFPNVCQFRVITRGRRAKALQTKPAPACIGGDCHDGLFGASVFSILPLPRARLFRRRLSTVPTARLVPLPLASPGAPDHQRFDACGCIRAVNQIYLACPGALRSGSVSDPRSECRQKPAIAVKMQVRSLRDNASHLNADSSECWAPLCRQKSRDGRQSRADRPGSRARRDPVGDACGQA